MIKRCPTCSRTYSDESISFCLADGALLSAPLNEGTHEPPPTEVLPKAAPPPPTQAANPAVPTITSLPHANQYSPAARTSEPQSRALVWIGFAIIAVAAIVGVMVLVHFISQTGREDVAAQTTATPEQEGLSSASPAPVASASVPTSQATPTARPT